MTDREFVREVDRGGNGSGVAIGIILALVVWVVVYLFMTGRIGNSDPVVQPDSSGIDATVTPPVIEVDVVE